MSSAERTLKKSSPDRTTTTFSRQVKDELARLPIPLDPQSIRAELMGFWLTTGVITDGVATRQLRLLTSHAGAARRIFHLFRGMPEVRPELSVQRQTRLNRRWTFEVSVSLAEIPNPEYPGFLADFRADMFKDDPRWIDWMPPDVAARKALLRAAFLGGGSVSHPKSGYHLEIRVPVTSVGPFLQSVLESLGIRARFMPSDDEGAVYLKDAESISDFLRAVGAFRALFSYEDTRIVRELRNRANRLVNSETANVTKTVEAAMQQLADIEKLPGEVLDSLSTRTREIIELRLNHPEASLREIGEMLQPPVTKSTVEYHFRKIRSLLESLSL